MKITTQFNDLVEGGVSETQFEELVKATPTDVRAIINEDNLQLQVEHDGQVLAIDNDFGKTVGRFFFTYKGGYTYIGQLKTNNDLITSGSGGNSFPFSVIFVCDTPPTNFKKSSLGGNILFLLSQGNSGYNAPRVYIESSSAGQPLGLRYVAGNNIVQLATDDTTTYELICLTTGERVTNVE